MSAQRFSIKMPRPLFRRGLRLAPGHPIGDRVLIREFAPADTTEGGLAVAEKHQKKYMAGVIVAAGDQAADRLYDIGAELGDEVWFAQYAGLLEEWQHVVGADDTKCEHDSAWDIIPRDDKRWAKAGAYDSNRVLKACRSCGTLKVTEAMLIMSVDDICLNVDLQARLESGELVRRRATTSDGATRYVLDRTKKKPDSFETERSK